MAGAQRLSLLHCGTQTPDLVSNGFSKLASEGATVKPFGNCVTQVDLVLKEHLVPGCSVVADHTKYFGVVQNVSESRFPAVKIFSGSVVEMREQLPIVFHGESLGTTPLHLGRQT